MAYDRYDSERERGWRGSERDHRDTATIVIPAAEATSAAGSSAPASRFHRGSAAATTTATIAIRAASATTATIAASPPAATSATSMATGAA